MDELPVQIITATLAIAGTILGAVNTYFIFRRGTVRLAIKPKPERHNYTTVVTIINLSSFPVTVTRIFFVINKRHGVLPAEGNVQPDFTSKKTLESRASFSFSTTTVALQNPAFMRVKKIMVRTECGYEKAVSFRKSTLNLIEAQVQGTIPFE